MSAGSRIEDDNQEYQYAIPYVTPSGHQFTFYDTPENERLIIKHASGSRIEFKADGSVFITSVKDMHTHSSILSSQSESAQAADSTTLRYDTDLNLVVQGRLSIKAKSLDLECGETIKSYAGTDLTLQGNHIIEKATQSISLEGTQAIHVDTKQFTERSVTHTVEEGTAEEGGQGGLNIQRVHGHTVIQNDDVNGGISIASAGYLNLVCGKERIDLVGNYISPTDGNIGQEGVSTFTTKVSQPQPAGRSDVSTVPGDIYVESAAGAAYYYGRQLTGSSDSPEDGLVMNVDLGDMTQAVVTGNRERLVGLEERVRIRGQQIIEAAQIFLN